MWQLTQETEVCLPVRGNAVVLWLKFAGRHPEVEWHTEHCWGKPALAWFGFVAVWKARR